MPTVYAASSYMKTIGNYKKSRHFKIKISHFFLFFTKGLYSEPDGTALCVLEGHRGGVTHVKFSPDGIVLYSGGRKDPEILWYNYFSLRYSRLLLNSTITGSISWDLRNPGHVLFTMNRVIETNQRIYFDLDPSGRYLITGII